LGNRLGTRFETASIIAISAVHRRVVVAAPRALRAISSTKAYLIGIPLTLAIPVAGGFLLLTALFTTVRWFGLLGAIAITFLVLAILLLCARLVGASVLALFRREPEP
jgi:asparagine N-glycosylation enzyme membrane subunit Stt3